MNIQYIHIYIYISISIPSFVDDLMGILKTFCPAVFALARWHAVARHSARTLGSWSGKMWLSDGSVQRNEMGALNEPKGIHPSH